MFGVLHMDNATFFKSVFSKIAVQQGYQYYHCDNVKDAMMILTQQSINLIITGTYVEDKSLLSVIDNITLGLKEPVPVMVFSSNHDAQTRNLLYEKGIVGFYEKNASFEKLICAIERIREQKVLVDQSRAIDICIVDDTENNCGHLLQQFTNKGFYKVTRHQISTPQNIPSQFKIYIVDLMSGYHFISDTIYTLRNKNPEAIIICLLAFEHYDLIHDILLSGADDYIIKPYHEKLFFAEFLSNIRNRLLMDQVKSQNKALKILALHDGLTQMFNHSYLLEKIDELQKEKKNYSICMLDLDFFKTVNDTYGHQVGDVVLKKVAHLIKKHIDMNTIAGRYGGEEFMLIGIDKRGEEMYKIAEAIRLSIEGTHFNLDDFQITISGGVSFTQFGEKGEMIIGKADQNLYLAKTNGRNCIVI